MINAKYHYSSGGGTIDLKLETKPQYDPQSGKWIISSGDGIILGGTNLSATVLYWFGVKLWGHDWENMVKK
jgi:hypothetical protein